MSKRLRNAFVVLSVISMPGYLMADKPLSQSLNSHDPDVQSAARNRALQLRWTTVNECLETLQSHKGKFRIKDPRLLAIQIIEKFRAPEAVDQLIRIVEYRDPVGVISENHEPTLADEYPAARALIAIGKPASRACIYELTKANSPIRREKLCVVIRYVEGVDVGRDRLQMKMRELESDAKRARFSKAITLYEKLFTEK